MFIKMNVSLLVACAFLNNSSNYRVTLISNKDSGITNIATYGLLIEIPASAIHSGLTAENTANGRTTIIKPEKVMLCLTRKNQCKDVLCIQHKMESSFTMLIQKSISLRFLTVVCFLCGIDLVGSEESIKLNGHTSDTRNLWLLLVRAICVCNAVLYGLNRFLINCYSLSDRNSTSDLMKVVFCATSLSLISLEIYSLWTNQAFLECLFGKRQNACHIDKCGLHTWFICWLYLIFIHCTHINRESS